MSLETLFTPTTQGGRSEADSAAVHPHVAERVRGGIVGGSGGSSPPRFIRVFADLRPPRASRLQSLVVPDAQPGPVLLPTAFLEGARSPRLLYPHFPGTTLAQYLRSRDDFLAGLEAIEILGRTVDALSMLHDQGRVHGSLTPETVLISLDGHVAIYDAGVLAALESPEEHPLGQRLGESDAFPYDRRYLAPEVLAGAAPTIASDGYSLGTLLYHVVGGRPLDADRYTSLSDITGEDLDSLDQLVVQLRSDDPHARPSLADVTSRLLYLHQHFTGPRTKASTGHPWARVPSSWPPPPEVKREWIARPKSARPAASTRIGWTVIVTLAALVIAISISLALR